MPARAGRPSTQIDLAQLAAALVQAHQRRVAARQAARHARLDIAAGRAGRLRACRLADDAAQGQQDQAGQARDGQARPRSRRAAWAALGKCRHAFGGGYALHGPNSESRHGSRSEAFCGDRRASTAIGVFIPRACCKSLFGSSCSLLARLARNMVLRFALSLDPRRPCAFASPGRSRAAEAPATSPRRSARVHSRRAHQPLPPSTPSRFIVSIFFS